MLKTALEIENSRKKTPTASIFLPACGKTDSTLLVVLFLFSKAMQRRFSFLKQGKPQPSKQKRRGLNISRAAYMAYLCLCLSVFLSLPVSAVTIWDKASEIMQDVYTQILTISTMALPPSRRSIWCSLSMRKNCSPIPERTASSSPRIWRALPVR